MAGSHRGTGVYRAPFGVIGEGTGREHGGGIHIILNRVQRKEGRTVDPSEIDGKGSFRVRPRTRKHLGGGHCDRSHTNRTTVRQRKQGADCNYGIVRCFIDSLEVANIDWTKELTVRKANDVVEALTGFILFDMGPRKGNVGGKAKMTKEERKEEERRQAEKNLERMFQDQEDPEGAARREEAE